jgi:hypothetical protein
MARVRKLPNEALNQAIVPHLARVFIPLMEAIPGYGGYAIAFHNDDPTATISTTFMADEAAAMAADEAARGFITGLDPRLVPETPFAEQGRVRIFETTGRPSTELPPFLHGCQVTVRKRINAPGADFEAVVAMTNQEIVPQMAAMDGFVLHCYIQLDGGRFAINVWETAEQQAAGDEAIAAFVAARTAETQVGEPEVNRGTIAYAAIPGLT